MESVRLSALGLYGLISDHGPAPFQACGIRLPVEGCACHSETLVHRTPRCSDRLREEDFTISSAPGQELARVGPPPRRRQRASQLRAMGPMRSFRNAAREGQPSCPRTPCFDDDTPVNRPYPTSTWAFAVPPVPRTVCTV